MSDLFKPGLAGLVAQGERVYRAPYEGTTAEQHKMSLELMVQKIREGYKDRRFRAYVGQVFKARGLDGRNNPTVFQLCSALLDHLRRGTPGVKGGGTVYTPDPYKTEYIQGAAATLCFDDSLCIVASDCDDLVCALSCLILSAGIPAWIVKETYGVNPFTNVEYQGHVLVGAKDERGEAIRLDPSTNDPATYNWPPAQTRQWIDPLKDAPLEIVGVGRPATTLVPGFGADPTTAVTIPQTATGVQIPGTWTNIAGNNVQQGLRYAIAISVKTNLGWQAADVQSYFSPPSTTANLGSGSITSSTVQGPQFLVEQVIPGSTTTSWILIGIARSDGVVAQNDTDVSVVAVLQETPAAVQSPRQNTAPSSALAATAPATNVGMGTALLWSAGIALAGGVAWGLYRRGHFKGIL